MNVTHWMAVPSIQTIKPNRASPGITQKHHTLVTLADRVTFSGTAAQNKSYNFDDRAIALLKKRYLPKGITIFRDGCLDGNVCSLDEDCPSCG